MPWAFMHKTQFLQEIEFCEKYLANKNSSSYLSHDEGF